MYEIMFYGGTFFTVAAFICTVVFLIKNNVAKLIGDITGVNVKKAVKKMDKKIAEKDAAAKSTVVEQNEIHTEQISLPIMFEVQEEITIVHTNEQL